MRLLGTAILRPHDRPVPPSYWVTGLTVSVVVLVSFGTGHWVPWFVEQMAYSVPPPVISSGSGWLLLGLGFGAVAVSAPWLAFQWPAFGFSVALLPSVLAWMDGNAGKSFPFGALAVLGAVVLTSSWRRPWWSVASAATGIVVSWLWATSDVRMTAPFNADIDVQPGRALTTGMAYTASFLLILGFAALLRRSAFREQQRRRLAARAGEVEVEAATVAERARLARDLHDVVAHHVSLIAVRAETAPYTERDLGDAAQRVLADVAADARLALDELRGVLGILGRAGSAERSPQPSWSDIPALVERSRAAGIAVTLEGDAGAVTGPAAGYAAYRVVQESLTNARRHAPGKEVHVELEATGHLLVVRVRNTVVAARGQGRGQGLVGMRERVEALGGRLTAGEVDDEFVVEATLPQGAAA